MRPPVVLLLVLYAACGAAAGGAAGTAALGSALLVVLPFLAYSAVVNDLADEHIDRVNLPEDARRVLAAGAAHRRQLWAVALGAGALTRRCGVARGAGARGRGHRPAGEHGLLARTRALAKGVIALLVLPACYVAVPYLLGLLASGAGVRASDLPLLAALYVGFIGRIILKDFRDLRGDALFGKRTFLVRHGRA